jgi:hypothetical protein
MRPHLSLGPALALALLAGCGALAGCATGSHAAASASPSAMSQAQLLDIGRQYSQCLRDHGLADFPDPVIVDGRIALPDDASGASAKEELRNNVAAQQACTPILDRLPASAQKGKAPTAQELQGMLQFAQCMRANGIPDFPDPLPDGTFPLPTPMQQEGKSPRMLAGFQACDHFLGDEQGIQVKGPGSGK